MLTAKNSEGIKVSAIKAIKKDKYFCPICGAEMTLKQGPQKAWHFSHKNCTDSWHYEEKTPWHKNWQDNFLLESQEVVMSNDIEKHIADVFINNTVIEFQHSSMTLDEFTKRNDFYMSLGYRVVWVFDTCNTFDNKKLESVRRYYDGSLITWNRKWKDIFINGLNNHSKVEIYLQLCTDAIDNLKLQEIIKLKEELTDSHPELFKSYLYEEEREYFDEHQDDKIKLIKIKSSYTPNYLIFDKNSLCDKEVFLCRITN